MLDENGGWEFSIRMVDEIVWHWMRIIGAKCLLLFSRFGSTVSLNNMLLFAGLQLLPKPSAIIFSR